MKHAWPIVKLGEFLTERREKLDPDELMLGSLRIVEKIGFGEGRIQLRDGSDTKTGMILIRPGDLVVSGINAAKGAIAIYGETNVEPVAATIHYGAYIPNKSLVDIRFLWWLLRSTFFRELLMLHVPGGIKTELKAKRLLSVPVPLPHLAEQQRIVARIEELASQIEEARTLRNQEDQELRQMLLSAFWRIAKDAPRDIMGNVAPLVRRPVHVQAETSYSELGLRSFGKGTFHKPTLSGLDLGDKRVFSIEPGDLLFSNVFAWEGAIAIAQPEDANRIGSHRYMSCVVDPKRATAPFLCFYFLTQEGLGLIGSASPGGAGRNRTLGIEALSKISVPVPSLEDQKWFNTLLSEVNSLKQLHTETAADLDALLPALLDRAFKGEL
jgi:type I restriction enzyme S subunit